jgi:hypothetical protein
LNQNNSFAALRVNNAFQKYANNALKNTEPNQKETEEDVDANFHVNGKILCVELVLELHFQEVKSKVEIRLNKLEREESVQPTFSSYKAKLRVRPHERIGFTQ